MASAKGRGMHEEIHLQPEYVRRLGAGDPWKRDLSALSLRRPVLTGCGTSFFAARLAAAYEAEAGRPVPVVQAFELLRAERLTAHGDLLIVLSHSGGTSAVLDLLQRARASGVQTVLITGYPESPAAALADLVVATGYAQELSWCHTISFTLASLTAIGFLHELDSSFAEAPDMSDVANAMEAALRAEDQIAREAKAVAQASSVWLLGAGPTQPLACEFALKLAEAAYIPAVPLELEQFFHGYIPAIERDGAVIAALPERTMTRAADLARVAEVVGFHLVDTGPFTGSLGGSALPWAQAAALQLLTYHTAMERDTDPDRLRHEDPVYRRARDAYR